MKGTFGFQVKISTVIILYIGGGGGWVNNLFNSVVSRATKQLWIFVGQNEKRWYQQQIKSIVIS